MGADLSQEQLLLAPSEQVLVPLVAACWEEAVLEGLKRIREASFPGCSQLPRKYCHPGFKYFLPGWKAKANNEGNETLIFLLVTFFLCPSSNICVTFGSAALSVSP